MLSEPQVFATSPRVSAIFLRRLAEEGGNRPDILVRQSVAWFPEIRQKR